MALLSATSPAKALFLCHDEPQHGHALPAPNPQSSGKRQRPRACRLPVAAAMRPADAAAVATPAVAPAPAGEVKEKRPRVLVAGGGIGGLVFALAARRKGYEVTVFERDLSAVRGEGQYRGPIQIQSNALAALEAIDMSVAEDVMRAGCVTGDRINGLVDGISGSWNLQMEYVDLYLIHWPVALKPGPISFPAKKEDAVPLDVEGVWRAMEECQRLGLAKAIGVSNFTTKHLDKVLAVATIPPAVNQVELNPLWQQRTLRTYCAEKGIHVAAYSPLGGQNWDGTGNAVMASEVLAGIAKARGKTVAQVALRWIYEQGVTSIVKSYNKERLKQNLEIFDWELTEEDCQKISKIPQKKIVRASGLFTQEGEFTSVDPADLDIVEE